MKKINHLAIGALISTFVIGAVSVSAFDLVLPGVTSNNTVKIEVDGELQKLPEDMYVLNYRDLNYTSARFIAESLGATVEFDEESNTIHLERAPYESEIIKTEPKSFYMKTPVLYKDEELSVELSKASVGKTVEITFDFKELPSNQRNTILFEDAYIEYAGITSEVDLSKEAGMDTVTSLSSGSTFKVHFKPLEIDGEKPEYIKVVLPIRSYEYSRDKNTDTWLVFRVLL